MKYIVDYGRQAAMSVLNGSGADCLMRIFTDAVADDERKRAIGRAAHFSALFLFAEVLVSAREAGVRFSDAELVTPAHLAYLAESDPDGDYFVAADKIVNAILEMKRGNPGLSVSLPESVRTETQKPAAVAPLQVQIVSMPDLPPVRVASMPGRETKTTIERDATGNISRSTQVEQDV